YMKAYAKADEKRKRKAEDDLELIAGINDDLKATALQVRISYLNEQIDDREHALKNSESEMDRRTEGYHYDDPQYDTILIEMLHGMIAMRVDIETLRSQIAQDERELERIRSAGIKPDGSEHANDTAASAERDVNVSHLSQGGRDALASILAPIVMFGFSLTLLFQSQDVDGQYDPRSIVTPGSYDRVQSVMFTEKAELLEARGLIAWGSVTDMYEKAIKADPTNPVPYRGLMRYLYYKRGDYVGASEACMLALQHEISPEHYADHVSLAYHIISGLIYWGGDIEYAEEFVEALQNINEESSLKSDASTRRLAGYSDIIRLYREKNGKRTKRDGRLNVSIAVPVLLYAGYVVVEQFAVSLTGLISGVVGGGLVVLIAYRLYRLFYTHSDDPFIRHLRDELMSENEKTRDVAYNALVAKGALSRYDQDVYDVHNILRDARSDQGFKWTGQRVDIAVNAMLLIDKGSVNRYVVNLLFEKGRPEHIKAIELTTKHLSAYSNRNQKQMREAEEAIAAITSRVGKGQRVKNGLYSLAVFGITPLAAGMSTAVTVMVSGAVVIGFLIVLIRGMRKKIVNDVFKEIVDADEKNNADALQLAFARSLTLSAKQAKALAYRLEDERSGAHLAYLDFLKDNLTEKELQGRYAWVRDEFLWLEFVQASPMSIEEIEFAEMVGHIHDRRLRGPSIDVKAEVAIVLDPEKSDDDRFMAEENLKEYSLQSQANAIEVLKARIKHIRVLLRVLEKEQKKNEHLLRSPGVLAHSEKTRSDVEQKITEDEQRIDELRQYREHYENELATRANEERPAKRSKGLGPKLLLIAIVSSMSSTAVRAADIWKPFDSLSIVDGIHVIVALATLGAVAGIAALVWNVIKWLKKRDHAKPTMFSISLKNVVGFASDLIARYKRRGSYEKLRQPWQEEGDAIRYARLVKELKSPNREVAAGAWAQLVLQGWTTTALEEIHFVYARLRNKPSVFDNILEADRIQTPDSKVFWTDGAIAVAVDARQSNSVNVRRNVAVLLQWVGSIEHIRYLERMITNEQKRKDMSQEVIIEAAVSIAAIKQRYMEQGGSPLSLTVDRIKGRIDETIRAVKKMHRNDRAYSLIIPITVILFMLGLVAGLFYLIRLSPKEKRALEEEGKTRRTLPKHYWPFKTVHRNGKRWTKRIGTAGLIGLVIGAVLAYLNGNVEAGSTIADLISFNGVVAGGITGAVIPSMPYEELSKKFGDPRKEEIQKLAETILSDTASTAAKDKANKDLAKICKTDMRHTVTFFEICNALRQIKIEKLDKNIPSLTGHSQDVALHDKWLLENKVKDAMRLIDKFVAQYGRFEPTNRKQNKFNEGGMLADMGMVLIALIVGVVAGMLSVAAALLSRFFEKLMGRDNKNVRRLNIKIMPGMAWARQLVERIKAWSSRTTQFSDRQLNIIAYAVLGFVVALCAAALLTFLIMPLYMGANTGVRMTVLVALGVVLIVMNYGRPIKRALRAIGNVIAVYRRGLKEKRVKDRISLNDGKYLGGLLAVIVVTSLLNIDQSAQSVALLLALAGLPLIIYNTQLRIKLERAVIRSIYWGISALIEFIMSGWYALHYVLLKPVAAVQYFDYVLLKKRDNALATQFLGRSFLKADNLKGAIDTYRSLVVRAVDTKQALGLLRDEGMSAFRAGFYLPAFDVLRTMEKIDKSSSITKRYKKDLSNLVLKKCKTSFAFDSPDAGFIYGQDALVANKDNIQARLYLAAQYFNAGVRDLAIDQMIQAKASLMQLKVIDPLRLIYGGRLRKLQEKMGISIYVDAAGFVKVVNEQATPVHRPGKLTETKKPLWRSTYDDEGTDNERRDDVLLSPVVVGLIAVLLATIGAFTDKWILSVIGLGMVAVYFVWFAVRGVMAKRHFALASRMIDHAVQRYDAKKGNASESDVNRLADELRLYLINDKDLKVRFYALQQVERILEGLSRHPGQQAKDALMKYVELQRLRTEFQTLMYVRFSDMIYPVYLDHKYSSTEKQGSIARQYGFKDYFSLVDFVKEGNWEVIDFKTIKQQIMPDRSFGIQRLMHKAIPHALALLSLLFVGAIGFNSLPRVYQALIVAGIGGTIVFLIYSILRKGKILIDDTSEINKKTAREESTVTAINNEDMSYYSMAVSRFNEGIQAFREGSWIEAIQAFDEASNDDEMSKNPELHFKLAESYSNSFRDMLMWEDQYIDIEEMFEHYLYAIEYAGARMDIITSSYNQLAYYANHFKDFDTAAMFLNKVCDIDPDDPRAKRIGSEIESDRTDFELWVNEPYDVIMQANIALFTKQYEKAVERFQKIIDERYKGSGYEVINDDPVLLTYLARAYAGEGKMFQAMHMIKRAHERAPDDEWIIDFMEELVDRIDRIAGENHVLPRYADQHTIAAVEEEAARLREELIALEDIYRREGLVEAERQRLFKMRDDQEALEDRLTMEKEGSLGYTRKGRVTISDAAKENELLYEGVQLHEKVHLMLEFSRYSAADKDWIASVIELQFYVWQGFKKDKEKGVPLGTTLQELVTHLRNDPSVQHKPLIHLLNRSIADSHEMFDTRHSLSTERSAGPWVLIDHYVAMVADLVKLRHGSETFTLSEEEVGDQAILLGSQLFNTILNEEIYDYLSEIVARSVSGIFKKDDFNVRAKKVILDMQDMNGEADLDLALIEKVLSNENNELYLFQTKD
ncbi:MAG: hypothetical protein JW938_06580, partial [Candidatus Omnitrophica bacterium]|nr:hypothetical protein [Candidatus Omnitrophota bacterium]